MPSHRTLLLVDDEELVRNYLNQLLPKHAWTVTVAASGEEALARLVACDFNIVVCDLDLGRGPSGFDILQRMPSRNAGKPFVILTGHGTIDRYRHAVQCGVTEFLEKPISPMNLFSALERALGVTTPQAEYLPIDQTEWRDTIGDRHVRRALRMIERELTNPAFSVEALAKSIPVSSDHLARLFRVHLGRTPLEQIHETRIRAAEKLLEIPLISIYEAAVDSGYRSTTEFDGWFRHFNGMTPSEWRAQRRRHG